MDGGPRSVAFRGAWLVGLTCLLGCSARGEAGRADVGPAVAGPAPSVASSTLESAAVSRREPALPAAPSSSPLPPGEAALAAMAGGTAAAPLAHFHDALRALAVGRRKEHVRIVWLGDSHAQADFWTGAVRTALQRRFGNAGPGFVQLGMIGYRHDGVDLQRGGRWRMRPRQPSMVERFDDGVFGLGGVLQGASSGESSAGLKVLEKELASRRLTWDLCYKPKAAGETFELEVGAHREVVTTAASEAKTLVHRSFETSGEHRLRLRALGNSPDFCGVSVATDPAAHPGVLLDALGINGARFATALAWDEAAWAREVSRRPTDLFVLEYGANEASEERLRVDVYRKNALALVARLRRIQPEASCLLLGPTARGDVPTKIPPIDEGLRTAAREAGCAYWGAMDAMGGEGSFRAWRDAKKGSPDGIHFLPKGYVELGKLVTEAMLEGYRSD